MTALFFFLSNQGKITKLDNKYVTGTSDVALILDVHP